MKILIIRFSSIGDIILTEPVTRLLKEQYPQAQIDYLTKPQYRQIPSFFAGVDSVISAPSVGRSVKLLRKKRYDLVVDLQNKLNSFIVKSFVPAARTVTYNKKRKLRRRIVARKKGAVGSTVALYFNIFDKLGVPECYNKKNLDIDGKYYPDIRSAVEAVALSGRIPAKNTVIAGIDKLTPFLAKINVLQEQKITAIALFPGALHATKQYPPHKLAEVIDSLSPEKYRFFILGSPGEKSLADKLSDLTASEIVDWCGVFNLGQLLVMINRFDMVVGNDSGPMHIAAALGKKQLAIFGATSPLLGFKPHNDRAVVVQQDLACRPCSLHGSERCPLGHFNCMQELPPDRIAAAIRSVLLI